MKFLKLYSVGLLMMMLHNSVNGQTSFSPGDSTLHYDYIKERNVFQKLVWIDSNGVITHTAILNLITRIDTINHTVTYLQIRNDGKKDSSVSSYPGLEPIYLSTNGNQFSETYDYRTKGIIAIHQEKNGKIVFDGKEKLTPNYFESYLGDLVMTTLPIERKMPLQYFFYNTNLKQLSAYEITKVYQDVLLDSYNSITPVYVLNVRTGKNEFLVYVNKASHLILKTVFVADNGSSFVKQLL